MTTAAEVQAELERVQAGLKDERDCESQLRQELKDAEERQRLRREVDAARESLMIRRGVNSRLRQSRAWVDEDRFGPHKPGGAVFAKRPDPEGAHYSGQCELDYKQAVSTATFEWKISGMSWLADSLDQSGVDFCWADQPLQVGDLEFEFIYCPWPRRQIETAEGKKCHVSLGMRQLTCTRGDDCTALRYRIYLMRRDGEYIQWGPQGQECMDLEDMADLVLGPDVTSADRPASGIFGLQHNDLLQSEWVQDDTLTVKFELEVREYTEYIPLKKVPEKPKVEVPATNILANLLSLFEEERCTDVIFKVKGETVKAHSQVLAARSEVFEGQFFGGLQESLSKEVVMEDVEPKSFKAFLKFLYTDDFDQVRDTVKALELNTSGSSLPGTKISFLQDILAMSHKYQVLRLLRWCEQELCEQITDEEVCSVLCQAHLCEAQQLEAECLSHIKQSMSKIVSTKEFAHLAAEWPDLLLKISLHGCGASSTETAAAVSMQRELRKRKREESCS